MSLRRVISVACIPLMAAIAGGYMGARFAGVSPRLSPVTAAEAQALCPTSLPPAGNFASAPVTQGQFKSALTNLVSYLGCLLGTDGTAATARSTLGLAAVASSGNYSDLAGLPAALPPSGTAGGDLSGSYPAPTVAKIQGQPVSAATPSSGQVLQLAGGVWTPASLASSPPLETVNDISVNYTIQNSDLGTLLKFSKATAQAIALPPAGAGGNFANGWWVEFIQAGAGGVTITPTTSTINGASSWSSGTQWEGGRLVSDGSNYYVYTGATGPQGPQGPEGPAGPAGPSGGGGGGDSGTCFLLDARVTMRGGRKKRLADVRIGDQVSDGRGGWNTVIGIDRTIVGSRLMARLNGEHWTSCEHPHMRADASFAALDVAAIYDEWDAEHDLVVKGGAVERRRIVGLEPGAVTPMAVGQSLLKECGSCRLITVELFDDVPEDTPLGNLAVDGSGTYVVDGYVVTGWPDHRRWDYEAWAPRETVAA